SLALFSRPAALRLRHSFPTRRSSDLGTGLGEALIVWDGARHLAVGSEGGHVDFAARTDLEVELLQFLRREFGRVSYERVLSGPGDRKSTRLNSSHEWISYAVFCLKKK